MQITTNIFTISFRPQFFPAIRAFVALLRQPVENATLVKDMTALQFTNKSLVTFIFHCVPKFYFFDICQTNRTSLLKLAPFLFMKRFR